MTDLGSSNGIFVESNKLVTNTPFELSPGMSVKIGDCTLVLKIPYQELSPVHSSKAFSVDDLPHEAIIVGGDQSHDVKKRFQLRYRMGEGEWNTYILLPGETSIGRGEDSDLCLDDHEISRLHSSLTVDSGNLWITDLGSTNGIELDGLPLKPHEKFEFEAGQKISMGNHEFCVEVLEEMGAAVSGTMIMPGDAVWVDGVGASETIIDTDMPTDLTPIRTMNLDSHERVTIGRARDNHVVLNHPLVSRYHAVFEKVGKRYRIKDLRSTNGVYVNKDLVDNEKFLEDYDQIRVGPFVFEIAGHKLQGRIETGIKITVENINQQVTDSLNLLKNINLIIEPNEFVALVGMSGSGKTTFLNAISGYWPASHGQVLVNGIELYENYDLFRNDVGYVPQKDIVHTELTPKDALDYVAQLRMPSDIGKAERRTVVQDVLKELDLIERQDVPISNLSGGQLKRVSIGVELLTKPRLFFLDEPTSGLDPGTEYDMMKLMRNLADQGRTVILITHATKNVMLCDKVVFLARGGNLAFYGAPEDALAYFDEHRTDRERREKKMEFDDIYRILDDDSRGAPNEWRERYLQSHVYAKIMGVDSSQAKNRPAAAQQAEKLKTAKRRLSSLRQFFILSARNLKIITQDRISLAMMLVLAPILGLMDFIWGTNLFDPVTGDVELVLSQWYMLAIVALLAGALSSVREIVKESDIYKRERAVNLRIFPYLMSKVWVGFVLAIYQAAVLMAFRVFFVRPVIPTIPDYIAFFITLFLGSLSGYLVGLMISSIAPNQNTAMILLIIILVPQFLFAGALLPIDAIPVGRPISVITSSRWAWEGFIKSTHMGDKIMEDPCLAFPANDRQHMPDILKNDCACMGDSIFTDCADFPGILSPDFYDDIAKEKLAMPEPGEPPQPTAYAYPTPLPSLTPIFTPTPLPSLTPMPTPADPREMGAYMDDQRAQGQEQQDTFMEQFEDYRLESQDQGQVYADLMDGQGDEYADSRQEQADEYTSAMQDYGDERADWIKNREKAISSAETLLGAMRDDYGYVFRGSIITRWLALGAIMISYIIIMVVAQKR
ncbi:MAG: FHA domain-containing protein, partial [Chloroflexota bacterium]|nr:FHA domain-containing protein [Chloroflexota bacterium]